MIAFLCIDTQTKRVRRYSTRLLFSRLGFTGEQCVIEGEQTAETFEGLEEFRKYGDSVFGGGEVIAL